MAFPYTMRELEIIKLTMVGPFEMNAKGQVEQCVYTSVSSTGL